MSPKPKNIKSDKAYIPMVFCPHCKEEMPVEITTMIQKKLKLKVKIAHCPKCEFVLNVDKDVKVRWVTEKEIAKMGWEKK